MAQEALIELPVDSTTRLVTYSRVVPLPGVSKKLVYERAKFWLTVVFSPLNGESHVFDEAAATVQGTGRHYYDINVASLPTNYYYFKVWFTVRVQASEGQYKYVVDHFRIENSTDRPPPYVKDGPVESTLLRLPANHLIRDIVLDERKAVEVVSNNFLSSLISNMVEPQKQELR